VSHITQHLPGSLSSLGPKSARFDSEAALMVIPWVAAFATEPGFLRYSLWCSDTPPYVRNYLMAEYSNGTWFVIGRIDGVVPNLPTWTPSQEREAQ
jgi:hypothetical protein